jgi:hypothetical protein
VSKNDFDAAFERFVKNLVLKPETFDRLEAMLLKKYQQQKKRVLRASTSVHETIAALKTEQKAKADAFVATTSPVLRVQLEKGIEELEVRIKTAASESHKINITEEDIRQFKTFGIYCLEHLSELLLKPENSRRKENLFSLIFEEFPTYSEMLDGTVKMASIFTLSPESDQKGIWVRPVGFSWNTVEYTIKRWMEVFSEKWQGVL